MEILLVIAIIGSVFFGVTRPFIKPQGIDKRDIYKDMAHVFVGFLIGIGCVYYQLNGYLIGFERNRNPYMTLALIITVIEVVSAVVNRLLRKRANNAVF